MRLEQLQYLIMISQCPSMSVAAEKLHLTPQALSMSISSMEKELELTLLNRSYKGVSLTEDGREIMKAGEVFLHTLATVQQRHQGPDIPELSGDYDLLTTFGETNYFFLEMLTQLAKDHPRCRLRVKPTAYQDIKTLVSSQPHLLAMSYRCYINDQPLFPSTSGTGLSFTPLFSSRLVVHVPRSYPISVYKTISLKTLLDYPIILYRNENDPLPLLQRILEYFGTPTRLITHTSSPLCQNMVSAGNGIGLTLLPNFQADSLPPSSQVVNQTVRDDIKITCGLVRQDNEPPEDLKLLINYILNFAASLQ